DCNADPDANGNSNRDADCHAKSYSDTKAAPDSTASPDSAEIRRIPYRRAQWMAGTAQRAVLAFVRLAICSRTTFAVSPASRRGVRVPTKAHVCLIAVLDKNIPCCLEGSTKAFGAGQVRR